MSLQACRDLVAQNDADRFLPIRSMPEKVQAKLLPILALNIEVSRAPWLTEEAMIAEMRLQWWRDALEEISEGKEVRRHEVTTPLAEVLSPEIARELDGFVAARRWDIYRDPFENAEHQEEYIRKTGGLLMWAMATTLGAKNKDAILRFGMCVGVAGFLRAVPDLEARGRKPLLSDGLAGQYQVAQKGMAWADYAIEARRDVEQVAVPALLTGWWARPILLRFHYGMPRLEEVSEFRKRARLAKLGLLGWWR